MTVIEGEKLVVGIMIRIYCKGKHNCGRGEGDLCAECEQLRDYAWRRLDLCKYGKNKSSCKRCVSHCYSNDMRRQIRAVMRYAGWRMMFCAPLSAVKHLIK